MGLRKRDLTDNESTVVELHEHARTMIGPLVLFLILVAAVIATLLWSTDDRVTWSVVGVCVVIGFFGVFVPWLKWRTTSYTITTQRIAERRGIFTRTGRDIPLYRVNTIETEKHLIDRFFGCGTLTISDASEEQGLMLRNVPHVEAVHKKLQELTWSDDDGTGITPREYQHRHDGRRP
jgi:membrane protein YdbS with pleckstrin-like domain